MLIFEDFGNRSANKDGSSTSKYGKFCFADGKFTISDQTMEEMIQSSVENMMSDLNMSVEQATRLTNTFIRQIKALE